MSQSSTRPVLVGRRRRIPWALIPPLLVLLLAAGLWLWRSNGGSADAGQRQLAAGQYQQAVETFSTRISADPNNAQNYANRGLAYAGLQSYQSAIDDYSKALQLSPEAEDAPQIYNNRGLAYFNTDQDEQAEADYTKAIELKSDYAIAYVNRALLHQRHEQNDQAVADYTKALELNPQLAEAYVGRGQVYAEIGQTDKALADFGEAIRLNSKLAAAYNGRADIYLAQGQSDKAIPELRAVIANAGPSEDLLKNKAQSQLDALTP